MRLISIFVNHIKNWRRDMKKIIVMLILMIGLFGIFGCSASVSNDVVRIHIRANSNDSIDQEIKLIVRDNVIDYITPIIANCKDSNDVKNTLNVHLGDIEKIADRVLIDGGFEYKSKAEIRNEYFPTRNYNGNVFPADYYDALILELGTGRGDNWWCVAYPPLCFVGNDVGGDKVEYRSKLYELISKYFGGAK